MSRLPSVQEVDRHLESVGLPNGKPVRERVQSVLGEYRDRLRSGPQAVDALPTREEILRAVEAVVRRPDPSRLRRVINATGVVVHTNLGRAVLSPQVTEPALGLAHAYTNLEFDLATGRRGARGGRVPQLLAQLSDAEAGLVVNNNAAAVLLLLSALAAGGEVIVSRGELVEIGGAFRVPEIMAQSGARLVEVGATNRTRIADYEAAITENTRALLKVHRSNFTMSGFVEEVGVPELAALARERNLAVWHDLGSGNFYRFNQPALAGVGTVQQAIREGADVLTLSGDKLLGSVQAGIVVGRAAPVAAMRNHPLYRSLRMDKMRLVLLEAGLESYLEIDKLPEQNPTIEMLERTVDSMRPLASHVVGILERNAPAGLRWALTEETSMAGGGAVPEIRIETVCLALEREGIEAGVIADALRANDPPVVARVNEGRVLLDFRTLFESDLDEVAEALVSLGPASA